LMVAAGVTSLTRRASPEPPQSTLSGHSCL
jgi:hypothetical protein